MNVNSLVTKDYRKNDAFAVPKNKPNQTQPVVSLPALSLVEVSNQPKGSNLFQRQKNAAAFDD